MSVMGDGLIETAGSVSTPMRRRVKALACPVFWAGLLLAAYGVSDLWEYSRQYAGVDFYQQEWIVPRAVMEFGIRDIYSDAGRTRINDAFAEKLQSPDLSEKHRQAAEPIHVNRTMIDVTGTPFLYTTFRLFAGGDYGRDFRHYLIFCVAGFAVGVLLLARALGYSWGAGLVLMGLLSFLEPLRSDLRQLNVNCFQLLTLAAFLYLRQWSRYRIIAATSGVLLGLAAMFKPTVALPVVFLTASWLMNRRWRQMWAGVGLLAGAAAAVVLSSVFFGTWRIWLDFAGRFGSMFGAPWSFTEGNYSPAALARYAWGANVTLPLLVVLTIMSLLCLYLTRRRGALPAAGDPADQRRAVREDVLATGLACGVTLAASQLTWLHYYLLLIPLAMYVWRPVAIGGFLTLSAAALTRLLVAAAIYIMSCWPRPWVYERVPIDYIGAVFCSAMVAILLAAMADALLVKDAQAGSSLTERQGKGV